MSVTLTGYPAWEFRKNLVNNPDFLSVYFHNTFPDLVIMQTETENITDIYQPVIIRAKVAKNNTELKHIPFPDAFVSNIFEPIDRPSAVDFHFPVEIISILSTDDNIYFSENKEFTFRNNKLHFILENSNQNTDYQIAAKLEINQHSFEKIAFPAVKKFFDSVESSLEIRDIN